MRFVTLATDEVHHDLHHCCAKCNPLAIDDHKSGFCFPCPLPRMRFVMTFTTAVLSATPLHWWPQIRFLFPMSLATDVVGHDLHHHCAKCKPQCRPDRATAVRSDLLRHCSPASRQHQWCQRMWTASKTGPSDAPPLTHPAKTNTGRTNAVQAHLLLPS